jgi:hypothetical protein
MCGLCRSSAPKASQNAKQEDGANRCHDDGRQVEAFSVLEAEKAADKEAADKGADDANNQIGQQSVVPAGNPLGNPSSQDTNDDEGNEIHGRLLARFG